jgi:hypothetical protein
MEYKTLEQSSFKEVLGMDSPAFNSSNASFFATSSFVYMLLFTAIVGAAFYEYVLVGIYRMEASESGIRKSNETFKRTTLGLLGVFSLFLIIFTLNKSLLTGNVSLGELKDTGNRSSSGSSLSVVTPTSVAGISSGGNSRSCESTEATIAKLQASGGVCGGVTCTALSGCNYQQYLPIIDQAVGGDIQLRKMIIVTMCKESRADPRASHLNSSNGTYDCGLMQINQNGPCNPTALIEPENIKANIETGVSKMREKIRNTTQVYQNIPAETGPFSSYNCCANGTIPNSPSADCNTSSGFPFSIPKWACPINPGDGEFNMCSVKSYVCELSACMKQL